MSTQRGLASGKGPSSKDVAGANTVTKDFLLFSQPYILEGALLTASSGRRVYIHHLSELPPSEPFTTESGNRLQRVDAHKAKLAGKMELEISAPPPGRPTPTAKVLASLDAALRHLADAEECRPGAVPQQDLFSRIYLLVVHSVTHAG